MRAPNERVGRKESEREGRGRRRARRARLPSGEAEGIVLPFSETYTWITLDHPTARGFFHGSAPYAGMSEWRGVSGGLFICATFGVCRAGRYPLT